jgi:hypothetical protein
MVEESKKPRGWLIAALICFLLAIAGCGTAGIGCQQLLSTIQDIDTGNNVPMGQESGFVATSDGVAAVLLSSDNTCEGTDDAGKAVTFESLGSGTNVTVDGDEFDAILTFDVREDVSYALVCGIEGAGEYTVVRLPSFFSSGLGVVALTGGFLGGGFFLLLALVFLIVGLVRRARWKKHRTGGGIPPVAGTQPYGSIPPPPGQVPGDPSAPSMQPPGGAPSAPPVQPPAPGGVASPPPAPPQS